MSYKVYKQKVVEEAVRIIAKSEGKYNSVVRNDNGACSIGIMQWHGNRALHLLKAIAEQTTTMKLATSLGPILALEITNKKTDWKNRKLSNIEKELISKFLDTPIGREVQDKRGYDDVSFYVNKVIDLGITNSGTVIYLADAFHQYGINSKLWVDFSKNLIKSGVITVENANKMVLNDKTLRKYIIRRNNTYKAIMSLPFHRYEITT